MAHWLIQRDLLRFSFNIEKHIDQNKQANNRNKKQINSKFVSEPQRQTASVDRPIFLKACSYCAYQERTHGEVRKRLKEWKVWGDEADEIISELIQENYLNEERFAKIYAGSKFRVKKWGRLKIKNELKRRKISNYSIRKGMVEIDEEEYLLVLQALLHKKHYSLRTETNRFVRNQKAAKYAIQKGFEGNLVWEILKGMDGDD